MPERTWLFRSESCVLGKQIIFAWGWRTVNADGRVESSPSRFATLDACVRDAREHGFTGAVDAASGAFSPDGYAITVVADTPARAASSPD